MPRWLVLALAVTATGLGCTRAEPEPAPPPSVIWIVVDTLRPDHLEWYGYGRETMPSLRPLVEQGVLFEHAYAVSNKTAQGMASLVTGLYPPHHGVRDLYTLLHGDNVTAAERLKAEGYVTAAFVSSFVTMSDFSGLEQGFDRYDDFVDERVARKETFERRASDTLEAAGDWLGARLAGPDPAPYFLLVHLIDPHGPYDDPAGYGDAFTSGAKGRKPRPLDPGAIPSAIAVEGELDANRYVDRYDGEIRFLDHHLGSFLAALDGRDALGPALVVFTADHGESMGEHGRWFEHGADLYEENVRVPLLVKPPGGRGDRPARTAAVASQVDVLPTTLALLGLETPAAAGGLDGVALLPAADPRGAGAPGGRAVWLEKESAELWGLVRGRRKTLLTEARAARGKRPARAEQLEIYDLAADAGETRPGGEGGADGAALRAWVADAKAHRLGFEPVVNHLAPEQRGEFMAERACERALGDEDARAALEALGYLESCE